MEKKKVLVTGGAGYIGSHVVKLLGKSGHDVYIIDNLSTGNRDSVLFGTFIKEDLSNLSGLKDIFNKHRFDSVIHFAGSIKVPESVENPVKYYQNNSTNSLNVISCCKEFDVNEFIFSSTAAVYGELPSGYAEENLETKPINPYGRSKLMTEWILEDYKQSNPNFNYVAIRYFNVCGADPEGELGQGFPEPFHLINVACEAATGKREKLSIFGDDYPTEDGTCERDYIHVSDLAKAHLLALQFIDKEKKSNVFNCGYGHGFSVSKVIAAVKKVTGIDFPVTQEKRRDGDPAVLVAKSDKIKKTLNWKPEFDDIEFIIKTAYDWECGDTLKKWREQKS